MLKWAIICAKHPTGWCSGLAYCGFQRGTITESTRGLPPTPHKLLHTLRQEVREGTKDAFWHYNPFVEYLAG